MVGEGGRSFEFRPDHAWDWPTEEEIRLLGIERSVCFFAAREAA
jgi:hypothetical protein